MFFFRCIILKTLFLCDNTYTRNHIRIINICCIIFPIKKKYILKKDDVNCAQKPKNRETTYVNIDNIVAKWDEVMRFSRALDRKFLYYSDIYYFATTLLQAVITT